MQCQPSLPGVYEITSQTGFTCDGCGKQKRGVPTAGQQHELRDGTDALPKDWSDLGLQDFGTLTRAYFRHFCPGCTKRLIAIINSPFAS